MEPQRKKELEKYLEFIKDFQDKNDVSDKNLYAYNEKFIKENNLFIIENFSDPKDVAFHKIRK